MVTASLGMGTFHHDAAGRSTVLAVHVRISPNPY
jgi:hypothetical protein